MAQELASWLLAAQVGGLDDNQLSPTNGLRNDRQRRDLEDPRPRGHLVGETRDPLAPRVEHLSRPLPWPRQHPGVQLGYRVQLELQRRHNAEVPAAPTQRPEDVGLVLAVGAQQLPVGSNDFGANHAVAREPVLPREPAVSTTQRVADDPDLGRGPGQTGEAPRRGQLR